MARRRLQDVRNSLQVAEQRELPRRIVPLARVMALDQRGQRRERLDLHLISPPVRSEREVIAPLE